MKDKSSVPRCTHGSRTARVVLSFKKTGKASGLYCEALCDGHRMRSLPIMAQSIDSSGDRSNSRAGYVFLRKSLNSRIDFILTLFIVLLK